MPRATFFRCKTCRDEESGAILLYTPLKWKREGWVAKWRQEEDGSIALAARSRKPVAPSPICGFELARSGELLAAVTPDGGWLGGWVLGGLGLGRSWERRCIQGVVGG